MKTPDTIEEDIDRIRLEIHEETKDMTPGQITDYYRKSADAFVKKMGYKFVPGSSQNARLLVKIQPGEGMQ